MNLDTLQFWLTRTTIVACSFALGWLVTAMISLARNEK